MPVRMDAPSRIPAVAGGGQSEPRPTPAHDAQKPATRLTRSPRAIRSRNAQPSRRRCGSAWRPQARPPRQPVGQPPDRLCGRAARGHRGRRVVGFPARLRRQARAWSRPTKRRSRPTKWWSRPAERRSRPVRALAWHNDRWRGRPGPGPRLSAATRPAAADVPARPVRRLESRPVPPRRRRRRPWRARTGRTAGASRPGGSERPARLGRLAA
jgi:hypothetical protein